MLTGVSSSHDKNSYWHSICSGGIHRASFLSEDFVVEAISAWAVFTDGPEMLFTVTSLKVKYSCPASM